MTLYRYLQERTEEGESMKALTISQPYASLIAYGKKFVENRTWETSHRGRIAIHAGKGQQYMSTADMQSEGYPSGCIVAVADLSACEPFKRMQNAIRLAPFGEVLNGLSLSEVLEHEHTEGPYCWILRNVLRLSKPVPCRGAQGLWNVPIDVLDLVLDTPPARPAGEER